MISRTHIEMKPGRRLITTLNSKSTSRIKVLERLGNILVTIINLKKIEKAERHTSAVKSIVNLKTDTNGKSLDATELIKYISVLMHLMFDSWIEVCPEERNNKISETIVFSEASILLKHIKQLITEYTDILDNNDHICKYQNVNVFSKFPYTKTKTVEKFRKREEDFSTLEMTEKCLEQNLGICQI
ncbi:testis-expressed sequence 10 protein [Vespula squamosa]|uniref:Testis-expressed sequence 10 protein n=1 Tax=Vespula squamosa TaxID=30214 RepID=A0ABD2C4W1_VESSQ